MLEVLLFASYENLGRDYLVYTRVENYVLASHLTDGIDGSIDYRSNVWVHLWARQTHWD